MKPITGTTIASIHRAVAAADRGEMLDMLTVQLFEDGGGPFYYSDEDGLKR